MLSLWNIGRTVILALGGGGKGEREGRGGGR